MTVIKNGQISLCCHFNKIRKGSGDSSQSSALSQKNMLEMLDIQHNSIWPIFILIAIRIKKNKHKCNFYYVAVPMTSKVLKFHKNADFTKTQKSRYLKNKTFFFRQIKKSLITHQQLLYGKKNSFVAEVAFKVLWSLDL